MKIETKLNNILVSIYAKYETPTDGVLLLFKENGQDSIEHY